MFKKVILAALFSLSFGFTSATLSARASDDGPEEEVTFEYGGLVYSYDF